jgi:hypothetical protein
MFWASTGERDVIAHTIPADGIAARLRDTKRSMKALVRVMTFPVLQNGPEFLV